MSETEEIKKRRTRVVEPKFPDPIPGWGQETAGSEKTEGRDKAVLLFTDTVTDAQLALVSPREADGIKWDLKHFTQVS